MNYPQKVQVSSRSMQGPGLQKLTNVSNWIKIYVNVIYKQTNKLSPVSKFSIVLNESIQTMTKGVLSEDKRMHPNLAIPFIKLKTNPKKIHWRGLGGLKPDFKYSMYVAWWVE